MGVKMIPRRLPRAELKIAAASFPPIDLVRITAEETDGGMHPTITNLKRKRKAN